MAADQFAVGESALPFAGKVIPSGDYSAADPTPVEVHLLGGEALTVTVSITAQSGAGNTLTVNIDAWDPASGTWVNQLASAALTGGAQTVQLYVSHHMTAVSNVAAQKPIAPRMRVRPVKSGTTTTLTYSIGAVLT